METTRFLNTRYASQSSVFLVLLNFRFRLFRFRMAFLISGVINLDWPEVALRFLILMGAWSSSTSVYIFSQAQQMSLMSSNTYATLNGTHARSLLKAFASKLLKHLPFVKTVSGLDNFLLRIKCRPVCDHSGLSPLFLILMQMLENLLL